MQTFGIEKKMNKFRATETRSNNALKLMTKYINTQFYGIPEMFYKYAH